MVVKQSRATATTSAHCDGTRLNDPCLCCARPSLPTAAAAAAAHKEAARKQEGRPLYT